jgi:hypothetical protein
MKGSPGSQRPNIGGPFASGHAEGHEEESAGWFGTYSIDGADRHQMLELLALGFAFTTAVSMLGLGVAALFTNFRRR